MSAIISDCGKYRYRLEREVQPEGKVFAYFGVNPSTADAELDDATVRKWRGFTLRNGGRRFIVGNLFTYRATDVRELAKVRDVNDEAGLKHTRQIIYDADVLVPCWGSAEKLPTWLRSNTSWLLNEMVNSGRPVLHFGLTKDGQPKHPLMLGYDTPLIPLPKGYA